MIYFILFSGQATFIDIDIRYQKLQKQSAFFGGTSGSRKSCEGYIRQAHCARMIKLLPLIIVFNFDADDTIKKRLLFLFISFFIDFFNAVLILYA